MLIFRLPMDDIEVKEYKFVKMVINPESQDFYLYFQSDVSKVKVTPFFSK